METIGIRALRQNASRVVADVVDGEEFIITDRGRPVARMTAIPLSPLQGMIEDGRVRPARRSLADLPAPIEGESLSVALSTLRDEERC